MVIITLHSSKCLNFFSAYIGMNLCSESLELTLQLKTAFEQRPVLHSPMGGLYGQVGLYMNLFKNVKEFVRICHFTDFSLFWPPVLLLYEIVAMKMT